jgi:predicted nucleic acid-binding protein
MNVFLGTNVLMDVLLGRQPFAPDAQRLWFLAERGKIEGMVSALSFPNVYYIVRKTRGPDVAMTMLRGIRYTFHAVACDEQILHQAMDAKLSDFEDAVQYFSALRVNAVCMVTRNARHYPKSPLPIFTPHEFFSAYSFD